MRDRAGELVLARFAGKLRCSMGSLRRSNWKQPHAFFSAIAEHEHPSLSRHFAILS